MTIDELMDMPSEQWDKITETQLNTIAEQNGWLKITRPEFAEKQPSKSLRTIGETMSDERAKKLKRAREIAEQFGFDLD